MSTMTGSELAAILSEAAEALKRPSKTLEKAPSMTKEQLQQKIDDRIELISSGIVKGEELEQAKAEARMLAVMKLRRER
jgi:hypothetical protein